MDLVINIDAGRRGTLQDQIYSEIRTLIVSGKLNSGDRLPAIRELSDQLAVARNTVALAYDRLAAEGYVVGEPSVGTFVAPQSVYGVSVAKFVDVQQPWLRPEKSIGENLPSAPELLNANANRIEIDFWAGRPDYSLFPLKTWRHAIDSRLAKSWTDIARYGDPSGFFDLRKAITDHLRLTRGFSAVPEDVLITAGCQDALNLLSRMLIKSTTSVVIESPGYQSAACLFQAFGARLIACEVDDDGMQTERLPDIANAIAYVTPSHQFPMGVTLTRERRLQLLQWAVDTGSYVIEDDYDSDFRYQGTPLSAMRGLDVAGRVIYVGTFSKSIAPGIRLGYVVLPRALREHGRRIKSLMNHGQPLLEQMVLADFMLSGGFERHLRRARKTYLARRNVLAGCLNDRFLGGDIIGAKSGLHFTWRLPPPFPDASTIAELALRSGVGLYTLQTGGSIHVDQNLNDRHIVLGFASLEEHQIVEGVDRLAAALGDLVL